MTQQFECFMCGQIVQPLSFELTKAALTTPPSDAESFFNANGVLPCNGIEETFLCHTSGTVSCSSCEKLFHCTENSCSCGFEVPELRENIARIDLVNDQNRLAAVIAIMKIEGRPLIRALRVDGDLMALEGSNRLEAAMRLGLRPRIIELSDESSMIWTDFHDKRASARVWYDDLKQKSNYRWQTVDNFAPDEPADWTTLQQGQKPYN